MANYTVSTEPLNILEESEQKIMENYSFLKKQSKYSDNFSKMYFKTLYVNNRLFRWLFSSDSWYYFPIKYDDQTQGFVCKFRKKFNLTWEWWAGT